MPNGLQIRVIAVQHDWQPSAAMAEAFGHYPLGDNPAGREILVVQFEASDVGANPIGYDNSAFTLQRPGRHEQRVADLAILPPSNYGGQGRMPWLIPGDRVTTFVPYLVTPGENPVSFQYYLWTQNHTVANRLSISLQASGQSPATYVFTPNQDTPVR